MPVVRGHAAHDGGASHPRSRPRDRDHRCRGAVRERCLDTGDARHETRSGVRSCNRLRCGTGTGCNRVAGCWVVSAAQPLSAVLKKIRDMPLQPKPRPGERCELCAALIPDEHGHVVDLESQALLCACRPCYLVFEPQGAGGARFRAVPTRYMSFPEFSLSSAQWDALQIPVGVAFFFMNSSMDQIAAFYPSPAGATESLLPLDSWQ